MADSCLRLAIQPQPTFVMIPGNLMAKSSQSKPAPTKSSELRALPMELRLGDRLVATVNRRGDRG